jgi:hypothetical protein
MDKKTILAVAVSLASFWVYRTYQSTEKYYDGLTQQQYASEYLLGEDRLQSHKPYLWIHAQGEVNAREWASFGSRTSTHLNQPYLFLSMKSILDQCKGSFNVCLIDDDAFRVLLPEWNIKMEMLPSPVKEHYRQFGLAMLLHQYGGFLVPASTFCFEDLHGIYKGGIAEDGAFAVETNVQGALAPNPLFFGCAKRDANVQQLVYYIGKLLKADYTAEADFLARVSEWCRRNVAKVDGAVVGAKRPCGKPLDVADLLTQNALPTQAKVVYLDSAELLRRTKLSWFCRLSVDQLLGGDLTLPKLLLQK